MKRHYHNDHAHFCGGGGSTSSSDGGASGKGKIKMWEGTEQDAGDDELLAVLGYKVKTSDMAQVAQKLEQLEQVMMMGHQAPEDGTGLTHHLDSSDSVHYNPSDLSSWLQSLITELNNPIITPNFDQFENSSSRNSSDLKAIPGEAVVSPQIQHQNYKRRKPGSTTASPSSIRTESTRPVILVDDSSQENGIRLVHTLMACAEAIQLENLNLAEVLVKQIGYFAVAQSGGAMRKVATYFAEGLSRRIYGLYPPPPSYSLGSAFSDLLQSHFYETCPYLKFAHFTANQAILEAFASEKRVHVIDFSMKQGMQWPALMQALALRPGGPPSFRLTGIGPPAHDNADHLQEVGWKLAQLAETVHVEFEFRGFVANSLADLDASMLDLRQGEEAVAVNSVFELHQLLARPGAVEKVLRVVKEMKPKILTVVEQEANHNGPVFLDRFTESLHYYSTLFDSLEGCGGSNQDKVMSEIYLGRQICNVVACDGVDRVERHETLAQWGSRLGSAGFEPVRLGSNAFTQASMLLALFNGGDGYKVEESGGCLTLGWHTRPLIATSAWKLSEL
ncbi:hypothetical protein RHGRI_026173 [Rhododendron griersonianum]|uniref:DELLA protein n=1 Tax=Rhododendron griersonianum TaxID=479676 RepID=A0AAV6IW97_9ERIC|nr:hypothetical protein RHGRI_026173 [Rhododendron griersonianum]